MGARTGIQWADTTVNGTTGCDGCELWPGSCYAGALHEARLAKSLPALYARDFTEVRLAPGRMARAAALSDLRGAPRPDKPWIPPEMPRTIFVSDMSDALSKAVPFEYLRDDFLAAIDSPKGRRHLWLWLTKRPARLAEFAAWNGGLPPNLWAGTSITGKASLSRAEQLWKVPAALRFLSIEPQVESVTVGPYLGLEAPDGGPVRPIISLVINGGESDQRPHRARPFDIAWPKALRDQCKAAGVAFFLKQLGSHVEACDVIDAADYFPGSHRLSPGTLPHNARVHLRDSHGGDWSEWPADLRVREFPRVPIGA